MKALALGLAVAACQPASPPSIFLTQQRDGSGFITIVKARAIGTSMGDISVADINDLQKRNSPALDPVCSLAEVDRSSFVGTDRSSQLMLEEDFGSQTHNLFRQPIASPDGRHFVVQVGIAEECGGAVRSIIVIRDVSNDELVHVEMMGPPPLYLWPLKGRAGVQVADCIACDSYWWLTYDPKSRTFDWEGE